ncbi:MAG: CDP-glycerol glycerophosphotransferase family protein, partial [Bacteroidales bacterium]|nr:CDP-glycerol glycerophosphotransferase family protein [Bacteroidales bacterium]
MSIIKAIKKLLEMFYGYPIYLISFLIPRNPNKIVVGSHTPFNDNSKYFFILSQEYLQEYEIIWITKSKEVKDNINNLGLAVYRKNTLKGFYHSLT